jgi:hypothetical protein
LNFSNTTSTWDTLSARFEEDVFLAEFAHTDVDGDKSWVIRVGKGGNIYSYVGPFGEAMPPQTHEDAPFVDEVWQMVTRDAVHSTSSIYQAGVYQNTAILESKPFYSPSIAKHCSANSRQCSFATWGQQANVPSADTSSTIYYTQYTDCGNGVLEVTNVLHNAAPLGGDALRYLNVPYGGVRSSTFRDALLARSSDSVADLVNPLPVFGAEQGSSLSAQGGYLTFAEALLPIEPLLCKNGANFIACPTGYEDAVFVIRNDGDCSEPAFHTGSWGKYTIRCVVETSVNLGSIGCYNSCPFQLTNPRGERVIITGVVHWLYNGYSFYFWPETMTASEINAIFKGGDLITVSAIDTRRGKATTE